MWPFCCRSPRSGQHEERPPQGRMQLQQQELAASKCSPELVNQAASNTLSRLQRQLDSAGTAQAGRRLSHSPTSKHSPMSRCGPCKCIPSRVWTSVQSAQTLQGQQRGNCTYCLQISGAGCAAPCPHPCLTPQHQEPPQQCYGEQCWDLLRCGLCRGPTPAGSCTTGRVWPPQP